MTHPFQVPLNLRMKSFRNVRKLYPLRACAAATLDDVQQAASSWIRRLARSVFDHCISPCDNSTEFQHIPICRHTTWLLAGSLRNINRHIAVHQWPSHFEATRFLATSNTCIGVHQWPSHFGPIAFFSSCPTRFLTHLSHMPLHAILRICLHTIGALVHMAMLSSSETPAGLNCYVPRCYTGVGSGGSL